MTRQLQRHGGIGNVPCPACRSYKCSLSTIRSDIGDILGVLGDLVRQLCPQEGIYSVFCFCSLPSYPWRCASRVHEPSFVVLDMAQWILIFSRNDVAISFSSTPPKALMSMVGVDTDEGRYWGKVGWRIVTPTQKMPSTAGFFDIFRS
jgi:hypothetical protein